MKIEFPGHEDELASIEAFLERHTFPAMSDLEGFLDRLTEIDASIDRALGSEIVAIGPYLEEQKKLVERLLGKCQKLEVRKDVIDMAEEAEKLANSSPEKSHVIVLQDAQALRDRIDQFVSLNRPSRTNAKFIRFARACIDKAEKHEPVIAKSLTKKNKTTISLDQFRVKEPSLDHLEVGELLYDLARLLYQEKYEEFRVALAGNFSVSQQRDIKFHIRACAGSFEDLNNQVVRIKTVQGILGYAHELADYYMGDTPYPSIVEVHTIFQDLDFIEESEEKN